jgi:hypothetical protein
LRIRDAQDLNNLRGNFYFMRFSRGDGRIIKGYQTLRRLIREILNEVGDIFREYNLHEDGITYEQGDYFFLRFFSRNQEVSPGIKLSEKHIITPVCWVKDDKRCEKLGFRPDPEFRGYMIRNIKLDPGFLEMNFKDQKKTIADSFRRVAEELSQAGVIRQPGYFIAG